MQKTLLLLSICTILAGCSKGVGSFETRLEDLSGVTQGSSQATPTPNVPAPPPANPNPPPVDLPPASFCGPLDFHGVVWPNQLTVMEQKGLGLALSISGSFEGHAGWANISNNFDGQGLSLGLLQQNFGSGSLQPLMLQYHDQNLDGFKSLFAAADFVSLEQMLLNWRGPKSAAKITSQDEAELFPDREALSDLDISGDDFIRTDSVSTFGVAENASVVWAKANLYSDGGTTFVPRWKTSLEKFAISPAYRSIQVASALKLYAKAEAYFFAFGFTEIRSLLLMYDFVVQNGGFTQSHKDQFNQYIKANPMTTETQRALKLLEIRLVSVKPQYQADVRARKTTVINSTGTVHGKVRDLKTEFCFQPTEPFKAPRLP